MDIIKIYRILIVVNVSLSIPKFIKVVLWDGVHTYVPCVHQTRVQFPIVI